MQFGVNVSTSVTADPVADARHAELAGFDFVSASDHPSGTHPTYETWTMLTWIAAATSRIKLASRVLGLPNRHPSITAKMAETLDRLSGGRLILGLGGGAVDAEIRAFGLRTPSPSEKVEGLEEAVRIIKGLWTEPRFSFEGRHYRTESADIEPKPEHQIPIWLGTFGREALAVTGRVADGWIPTLELAPPERVPAMRDRILTAARDTGRDPSELTLVYNMEMRIMEKADPNPHLVSGPPEVIAERLRTFADLGFTAMNFIPVGPDKTEQVERIGREVLPAVRADSPSNMPAV